MNRKKLFTLMTVLTLTGFNAMTTFADTQTDSNNDDTYVGVSASQIANQTDNSSTISVGKSDTTSQQINSDDSNNQTDHQVNSDSQTDNYNDDTYIGVSDNQSPSQTDTDSTVSVGESDTTAQETNSDDSVDPANQGDSSDNQSTSESTGIVDSSQSQDEDKDSQISDNDVPVGTTSSVTGQVVQDVTADHPLVTDKGYKIISTQSGQVQVQHSDGTVETQTAAFVGAKENSDGTLSVQTDTGEMKTLPHTGDTHSILSKVGGVLVVILVLIWQRESVINIINRWRKKEDQSDSEQSDKED